MSVVTSIKFIDVPGFGRLDIREGSRIKIGGLVSQAETGDGSLVGVSEKFEVPSIECTAIHKPGLSLVALSKIRETNISMQSSTGSAWVLHRASIEGAIELTGADVPLRFIGSHVEELKA